METVTTTDLATSIRVLLHGGDTMLGRAVQLTFPHQAPHEELIRDSTTAADYLRMALHCNRWPQQQQSQYSRLSPPVDPQELATIRLANRDGSYLWGDYLTSIVIDPPPDVRVLNLETAITETIDNKDVSRKRVNYHMHSANVPLVFQRFASTTFAGGPGGEDCACDEIEVVNDRQHQQQNQPVNPSPYVISLANNHAMDFSRTGFERETLPALSRLPFGASGGCGGGTGGIAIGAGMTFSDAARACSVDLPEKHASVRCIALTTECAGTPESWSATATRSGMVVLPALTSSHAVDEAFEMTARILQENNITQSQHRTYTEQKLRDSSKKASEVLVLSIHWGSNWAYRSHMDLDYQRFRQMFAHRVVRQLGVDLIYGHSSHHIRGMEVYKRKLIVYGAGDLVNDYEGFANPGDDTYNTLGALFLVDLDVASGDLDRVALIPMYMDRLQLKRVMGRDSDSLLRWNPNRQQMESVPNAIEELRDAVNKLSVMDIGDHGKPVVLRVVDNWRGVPGAPVLLYP